MLFVNNYQIQKRMLLFPYNTKPEIKKCLRKGIIEMK